MARYTGPVCRLCRRERTKLFLKGERCYSLKCPVSEAVTDRHSRAYPPGEHGRDRMRQGSEYLSQLREKQKARRIYGLLEKQFRNLYEEANRQPGITGENLLRNLELRLDNVAFRAGWGASRRQARQFVRHGHVMVNGKRVTIPSYRLRQGQTVTLKQGSREMFPVRRNMDTLDRQTPAWLADRRIGIFGGGAEPAAPGAHRRARAGAAHRRAVLEVAARPASPIRRPSPGPSHHRGPTGVSTDAHHPATDRRGSRRGAGQSSALRRRPPRSWVRPHPRQLAPADPAVLHPGRSGHPGAVRRGPSRVHHPSGGEGGRHRHHPQPEGPSRPGAVRRAGDPSLRQAGPGRRHRGRPADDGRRGGPQPRPAHRLAQRQGTHRLRRDGRAGSRLRLRRQEQALGARSA